MDVLLFLGPPGSGKGTLSQLCIEKLKWKQLSTGNLCRKHIAQKTKIGNEIDFAIKSGKLVSDSLIVTMVKQWFDQALISDNSIIFDGFPRTLHQAELLEQLVQDLDNLTLTVVRFVIPKKTVINRLCERFICKDDECQAVYSMLSGSAFAPKKEGICDACQGTLIKRLDDTRESIVQRLEIYHAHESKLLDFYKDTEHPIIELQVDKPLKEIYTDFLDKVEVNKK